MAIQFTYLSRDFAGLFVRVEIQEGQRLKIHFRVNKHKQRYDFQIVSHQREKSRCNPWQKIINRGLVTGKSAGPT